MHHYGAEKIRNVVLISHSGAGKTSLAEAVLFASGAVNRLGSVADGTTTSDYEPEEIKRRISINLSLLPCQWNDTKLNLIDTPGYPDFVGEVKASLRVSESGVIVVCAASGVEVGTEQVWKYANETVLPCLIFVNKMDRDNADFFRTLDEIQSKLGKKCLPIQLPIGSQKDFVGVMDLVTLKSYGISSQEIETPAALLELCKTHRERLVEAVVEVDDELITKYLDGKDISTEELRRAIKQTILLRKIVPVLAGSALRNIGVTLFMNLILDYLPTPQEKGVTAINRTTGVKEEVEPTSTVPLTALVFRTSADPYICLLYTSDAADE